MKTFLVIFIYFVSSECGLLKDLLIPESTTPSHVEYHQGVLTKVVETLDNGTTIIIDALGNVITIHPNKKNEETIQPKGTLEITTKSSPKDNEIVKKAEAPKSSDLKPDLPKNSSEKVKVANITIPQNQSADKIEKPKPKPEENKDNPPPTEINKGTNDTMNSINNGDAKNTTDTGKVDNVTAGFNKNCTATNKKPCGDDKANIDGKMFIAGDACPDGKDRAADGTCVEVE